MKPGAVQISWYRVGYHDIKISSGGVYNVFKRHGLNRLPADSLLHNGIPKSCTIHADFWVGQDRD